MAYTRADVRTEVRDTIDESVADLWTDARLNKFIASEIRGLPRKGIYLEEIWEVSTEQNKRDYPLPDGTYKVELVERNYGTASVTDYQEVKGWDNYGGALWLDTRPVDVWTMRIHIRKAFTTPVNDVDNLDIPDEKMEVVVVGAAIRAYRMLMGYLVDAKNWDTVSKPNGISMPMVQSWIRDLKADYLDLIKTFRTQPRVRDINLVD